MEQGVDVNSVIKNALRCLDCILFLDLIASEYRLDSDQRLFKLSNLLKGDSFTIAPLHPLYDLLLALKIVQEVSFILHNIRFELLLQGFLSL